VRFLGGCALVAVALALTVASGASAKTGLLELNNKSGEHLPVESPVGLRVSLTTKTTLFGEVFAHECSSSSTTPGRVAANGATVDPVEGFQFDVGPCLGGFHPAEDHMYNGVREVVLTSKGKATIYPSTGGNYFDYWYLNIDRTGSEPGSSCWYKIEKQKGTFSPSAEALIIEGTGKATKVKKSYTSRGSCAPKIPIAFRVELFEHQPELENPLVPELVF